CMLINQSGTYYLTEDIIDSQVDECIIINASNVVFDCQNHYIDGVNKEYSVGIFILEPNVTIMNCKIKDWYSGIITDVDFINLINNTIENSFFGIQISGGDYIRISGVFGYSLINGIYAFPRSRHGIIEKCILEGTGEGDGIHLETGLYPEDVSNWTILSCSVSGFNGGILILGENITISEISSFNNAIGIVFGGVFSVMNNSFIYNNSQFGLIYSGNEGIYSSGLIYNNFFNNTNNFIVGFAFPTNWEEPYASKFNITKTEGTNIIGKPYLGGNVWSTPEGDGFSDICDDEDGDWICDEPYTLAVRYDYYWIDYLPLKSAAIMPECERFPPEVEIIPSSQTVYRLQVAQYLLKVKNNNTPQCSPSVFYMHDILCEGSYCVVCTEKGCHPPVFPSIDTTPIEPQEVRYYPINVTPLQAGNWTFVYRVYDSSTYYYTDAYANIKALPIPCEPRNFSADWKWGWGGWFLPKNITRFRMNNCGVIVITNNDYGDTCEPRNFTVTPICPSDLECTPSGNFTIAQGEAKEIWACGKPNSVKNFTMSFRIYDPVTRYSKILSWSFSTHPCAYLDIPINYVLNSDISYDSTCFTIVSSNVVLDCNNHEVVGPFWYSGVDIFSGNVTIKNCIFKQWQTGINFIVDNINMQNIMVVGFNSSISTGIWGSGNNIKMREIKAINCQYGIYAELTNSSINESVFINNTNGIMITGLSTNVSINKNSFLNNTYHIRIWEGPTLIYVENNKIKEGHVGIEIWRDFAFTFNNFIIGNEIDRTSVAIWLTRTYGNTIYSNTLTPWDDDVILYQVGINVWNSTKGGNYWSFANRSGYSDTCADTNQDGFCDEPYVLDEMNIDYLPLSKFVAPPVAEARYCQICDPTGMGLLAIVCVIVNILFCFPILILILVILFAIYSFWRKYGG
ncbi:MAG: hypothetical protein JTT15_07085, partial [Candidatus Brockarchaeota archaeon]|nr:hypothetical protein [Candidatus Brockarchaeota archaeon]